MKAIFDEMTKPRTETSFRETKRTSLYSKFSVPLGHDEDHRFARPIHNFFKDFMGAAIINANCFGTYACMMGTQFYFCVFFI